jgi:hypothetical protein
MRTSEQKLQIILYFKLKKSFEISHKTMKSWLGVSQSVLHGWLCNSVDFAGPSKKIECRLNELEKLSCAMEPDNRALVKIIAFSPIYGEKEFGRSILSGKTSEILFFWYKKSFSRFEFYRRSVMV